MDQNLSWRSQKWPNLNILSLKTFVMPVSSLLSFLCMAFLTSTVLVCIPVLLSSSFGQDLCKFVCHYLKNSVYWSSYINDSGDKTSATTIENDHKFSMVLGALLKNQEMCQVHVKLDVNEMEGFTFRTMYVVMKSILYVVLHTDFDAADLHFWYQSRWWGGTAWGTQVSWYLTFSDAELIHTLHVPHVDAVSELAQLHGAIILELKKKWPFSQHQDKNSDVSYCYILPCWA